MDWWKRLVQLREEKGLLQKDIANYLGVARNTYTGYELGKSEPSIEKLKMLAKYYDCSLDYLLGVTDDINAESTDISITSILKKIKINDLKEIIELAQKYQGR